MDKKMVSGSTSLLLLGLLSQREMYGYEMIEALALRSDKTFELKAGTLYPLLHSLEKQGAVKAAEKTSQSGRERRYYAITPAGRKMLKEKMQEWENFTGFVNKVLEGGQACAAKG